ncbi:MAG: excinuclease ABC subunit UvrA, partial [Acidobacteria bacterium]|nr:excinuclease ABC subunit UvrA [Acidobacteriota bacterium]
MIRVKGARQHNLKGINFTIPLNRLTVVTGVSGSGKSSLAFDTLYAEGQRRYIESFSTYARQFLDRMDKPEAESIQGIPAAIAIDQKEPVKTSRSTVGTMTEVNDFLKLLFARFGVLHCSGCGDPVKRDTPQSLWERIEGLAEGTRLEITFPAGREGQPLSGTDLAGLERLGFHRAWTREGGIPLRDLLGREDREGRFEILADRLVLRRRERSRVIDSLEQAIHFGLGRGTLHVGETDEIPFSSLRRCARCDLTYRKPVPSLFSFNHPLGACDQCKGFGRTIEIDIDRVIPDPSRTLAGHAIKPWSTQSYRREYRALLRFCRRQAIPIDRPFSALPEGARRQIISGTKDFSGVLGYFRWLGRRVYRMHIRVLLSRYRGYRRCEACRGRRLQKEGLLYRIGGQTIADLWGKSITACRRFFEEWDMGPGAAEAEQQLLSGIRARLRYLEDVGLGYLTLDRSTRTLSGGEVQRVSLTTALGSSLVNTLYVLDEPSIGLHPRDNDRLLRILRSLRDRRNTVVVVEHDPAVIRAADRILDLGPGAGEAGGKIVYSGGYKGLLNCRKSLTGQYLSGARTIPVPAVRRTPVPGREVILRGVECNNLKGIDVRIPLGLFVCVTGVSGSGKSTLVEEVLHKVLTGKGRESIGDGRWCRAVEGRENAGEVVLVDQAPIGRT